jgi:hypothetical protein
MDNIDRAEVAHAWRLNDLVFRVGWRKFAQPRGWATFREPLLIGSSNHNSLGASRQAQRSKASKIHVCNGPILFI